MAELAGRVDELRRLVKTDPDPRVCRRAQAVLMLAQGGSVLGVARWFCTAPHRVRAWRAWFLEGGRDRLADDPRCGRPLTLGARRYGRLRRRRREPNVASVLGILQS